MSSSDGRSGRRGLAPSAGAILELIRQSGGLSRAQLLERSGIARSTLYARLEELSAMGLVYEAEALESARGRPSRRIRFDDRGRVILTLSIGQSRARVAVTDTRGRELRARTVPVSLTQPPQRVLDPLIDIGRGQLADVRTSGATVLCGVGVAVPAPVNVKTGVLRRTAAMPGWPADVVVTTVGQAFDAPVVVENDGRAAALGEASAEETLVYVKVATGIGCGIVVDGTVLEGARGVAGDIGHILVTSEGPVCRCGRRGCLAAWSSGLGLLQRLGHTGIDTLDDLATAVERGDPAVLDEIAVAADHLGRALAATVATVNPDRLVLGGVIGRLPPMVDGVRRRVFTDVVERVAVGLSVEASRYAASSATRGLARLVMRRVFAPEAIDALVQAASA